MKYTKSTMGKDLLDTIDGITEESNLMKKRIEFFEVILTLINDGQYDEMFTKKREGEKRINMPGEVTMKANKHVKTFGYRKLADAIYDVLVYEFGKEEEEQIDFDDVYYKMLQDGKIIKD